MISDAELKALASVDMEKFTETYAQVFNLDVNQTKDAIRPLNRTKALAEELIKLREQTSTPCEWLQRSDGFWNTRCGHEAALNSLIKYCPFCGKGIKQSQGKNFSDLKRLKP